MNIIIRQEQPQDYKETESVIKLAFSSITISDKTEHELVARIRKSDAFVPELSLVAKIDNQVIGHVLLSRIKINSENKSTESLALAPVSVLPELQQKGVGKLLINTVLQMATDLDFKSVIVLGHPEYYSKFGFKPASLWGIKAPFNVPDEVFMALELSDQALNKQSGTVEYPSAFKN
jgi:predicted N-acetyltransferase YhbS